MKHLVILIALSGVLPLAACAETNASRQVAMELLTVMDFCGALDTTLTQMKAAQLKQAQGRGGPDVSDDIERSFALVREFLDCEPLKAEMAGIYAGMFTEEQLQGVLAFFRTDTGRDFNAKQPELMRRSMEVTRRRMQEAMTRAMEKMRDEQLKTSRPSPGPLRE